VLLAGTVGLVGLEAFLALVEHRPEQLGTAIIGLGMALAVLAPAHLLSPEAIDHDELLFGLLCGAGLGWFGIWNVAFGLVLALALGALVAGPATVARRRSTVAFPLVPVLAVSAYVASLWGQPFLEWYH
jgi:prepilin signal peptidase PulO-like enzyme (type II secretory pathway)